MKTETNAQRPFKQVKSPRLNGSRRFLEDQRYIALIQKAGSGDENARSDLFHEYEFDLSRAEL